MRSYSSWDFLETLRLESQGLLENYRCSTAMSFLLSAEFIDIRGIESFTFIHNEEFMYCNNGRFFSSVQRRLRYILFEKD
jgi:hypothetical protein